MPVFFWMLCSNLSHGSVSSYTLPGWTHTPVLIHIDSLTKGKQVKRLILSIGHAAGEKKKKRHLLKICFCFLGLDDEKMRR